MRNAATYAFGLPVPSPESVFDEGFGRRGGEGGGAIDLALFDNTEVARGEIGRDERGVRAPGDRPQRDDADDKPEATGTGLGGR
jgi:hypothetical protein